MPKPKSPCRELDRFARGLDRLVEEALSCLRAMRRVVESWPVDGEAKPRRVSRRRNRQ